MLKIAFLFLTITHVYHEEYWKDFLRNHEDHYSIYVHSKKEMPDHSYFKPYEMRLRVPTTWANTMKAQVAVLQEALKDPDNQKFIFVSESTIPLQDFDTIYERVMATDKSIFFYRINPYQDPESPFYNSRNLNKIAKEFRYKNAQWVVLNREHASLMTQDKTYLDLVVKYESDQELYPATFLSTQGKLDEIEPTNLTYVNWDKINPVGRARPFVFSHLHDTEELQCILNAINDNLLFARKFADKSDLSPLDPYLGYRNKHKNHHKLDFPTTSS